MQQPQLNDSLKLCIENEVKWAIFSDKYLPHGIYQIYKYIFCVCNMPNLEPWVNQIIIMKYNYKDNKQI